MTGPLPAARREALPQSSSPPQSGELHKFGLTVFFTYCVSSNILLKKDLPSENGFFMR